MALESRALTSGLVEDERSSDVQHALARRVVAEGVGTFFLVFFGVGSVPAVILTNPAGFAGAELGLIALSFGFIIAAAVYCLGRVSGCHINPVVTVALAASGRFAWRDVPWYVVGQLTGAALGAFAIWGVFADKATALGYGFGVTHFGQGVSWGSGLLGEGLGTACLLFVILGLVDKRAPAGWAGLIVGLTVAVIIIALGPITGGSINPARSFGPLLVSTIADSVHNWLEFLGYLGAQVVGALVGCAAYDLIAGSDR